MSQQGNTSGGGNTLLADAQGALSIAGTLLAAFAPGGMIGSFAVGDVLAIANAVVAGVPDVVTAFDDLKSAVDGGAAPTAEQIAALKTAVDAQDDQIQADVAKADAESDPPPPNDGR